MKCNFFLGPSYLVALALEQIVKKCLAGICGYWMVVMDCGHSDEKMSFLLIKVR